MDSEVFVTRVTLSQGHCGYGHTDMCERFTHLCRGDAPNLSFWIPDANKFLTSGHGQIRLPKSQATPTPP